MLTTSVAGLSLIPADRNLTGAEIDLVSLPHREQRLRTRARPAARPQFDYIFIDTPPSLGLLTLNALVAADAVLIPLNCEYFALEGLADLVATLRRVRAAFNPALDIAGVLMTMYDERTNLGQQVARDIRAFFEERVYTVVIPRNVRLGEAPSHGLPGDSLRRQVTRRRGLSRARARSARARRRPHHRRHGATPWLTKRPALGRGLSALIPDTLPQARRSPTAASTSTPTCCGRTSFSRARRWTKRRSRSSRDPSAPTASSSRSSSARSTSGYEIVAGERRWRASQRAGLLKVPVVVRDIPEERLLAVALIENIQREDLNPIEEATAYRRLADEYQLTQEQIADAVGKERSSIANFLRLLKLPAEVRTNLGVGHALDGTCARAARSSRRSRTAPRRPRRHRAESVGARDRGAGQEGVGGATPKSLRPPKRTCTRAPPRSGFALRLAHACVSRASEREARSKSISLQRKS